MKKALLLLGTLVSFAAPLSGAASYTFTVTSTLSFPSANPTTTPTIAGSAPVIATILIVNPNRENFTISVQSLGANLVSAAGDTIAVNNVTWSAIATFTTTGPPPTSPPSISATPGIQTLTTLPVVSATGFDGRAAGTTDTYTGTVTHSFFFSNSWFYSTGVYTQTLLFTFATV